MTLPIGSGFYTGDIPGKVTSTSVAIKAKPLLEQTTTTEINNQFVKNTRQGQEQAEAFFQANSAQSQYSNTIYDQPNAQTSKAISTYTEFANLERRAEVQSMIGVDIYA
ncbi:hypothetical protein J8L70_09105 [Pseudoalteromonas sp. MMG010]|uniref:hypothetical protein n=1 Tax=Pseudoalteromonas sp. MMG010 TaxID=2822685 RepID=UPI001B3A4D97|nr:hypothetical protein [Pseudoalteromonas sp. MMG010]MBQ4833393.1 hypothetical protein [Pseudoalteromonas sp. MMG010]